MSRNMRILIAAAVVVVVVAVGIFLYLTRPLDAPTADIQADTQQLDTTTAEGEAVVYRISQANSQAEFNIDEVLAGQPKTVIGATDQVAGDILVNLSNPAASEIGQIRINARTFKTDDSRRDSAIGRFILRSESADNEFVTFQPASISGLPASIAPGDTLDLQVTGDLTVSGTTQTVTFDVSVTLDSEERISGTGQTTVRYADFNLTIPNVPFVTDIADEVILKVTFVADRVAS